jgi:hypothetical protein
MSTNDDLEQLTLFVYYKLPVSEHSKWATLVREFKQDVLQAMPGLTMDLMQRPEPSSSGEETWMEVYRHPSGVSPQMMAQIDQMAQVHGLPTKRSIEIFVSLK